MSEYENVAILLSGGVGARISSDVPKQYVRKDGVMMITYVLRTLMASEWIDGVVIVADEAWRDEIRKELPESIIGFAEPGENRQLSIVNAMEMLDSDESQGIFHNDGNPRTVFVHDAARPYLTCEDIAVCFEALGGHDGVMPALPMKDTVYLSRDGNAVSGLLERSEVFAGQAPELFLYEPYLAANRALSAEQMLKINGSTEPAILAGMDVVMIPGDETNRKVTTDVDMEEWMRIP